MMKHLLIQQRRRAAGMMRLLLRRAGYPLPLAEGGYPCSRYLAPDQCDLPLYEPANIRGYFWGPTEEKEEVSHNSPACWEPDTELER